MTNLPAVSILLQYTSQNLAVFCGGLFSGAAIYISLTECPPRSTLPLVDLLTLSRFTARRTNSMLAVLAAVAAITSIAASLAGAGTWWLVGGVTHSVMVIYLLTGVARTTIELENLDLGHQPEIRGKSLTQRRALQIAVLSLAGLLAQYFFIVDR